MWPTNKKKSQVSATYTNMLSWMGVGVYRKKIKLQEC